LADVLSELIDVGLNPVNSKVLTVGVFVVVVVDVSLSSESEPLAFALKRAI
jgi:hypothetical protein